MTHWTQQIAEAYGALNADLKAERVREISNRPKKKKTS